MKRVPRVSIKNETRTKRINRELIVQLGITTLSFYIRLFLSNDLNSFLSILQSIIEPIF